LALRALAPSLKPKACVSRGAESQKWAPEINTFRARNPKKLPPEGWGSLNKGCERRARALPGVSGGRERHDRLGVVVDGASITTWLTYVDCPNFLASPFFTPKAERFCRLPGLFVAEVV
jgi:hypothetical protein